MYRLCFLLMFGSVAFVDAALADSPALKGTWKITTFHDDGKDRLSRLGVSAAKKGREPRIAKLVFAEKECYLIRGDGRREMASGLTNAGWKSFHINHTTTPKRIDIVGFAGKENEKTKTYPGIYEIDGEALRICYAESGSKRPTEFESTGQNNLFVCQRTSTKPLPLPEPKRVKDAKR